MDEREHRILAEVEDGMGYFRALHAQVDRELSVRIRSRAASILDAGCGTGGLIRRLAPLHPSWKWTGLDLSATACGLARERTPGVILEGSVTRLPFADGSLDAVVVADVLYHVDDDGRALREIRRVLAPGGVLVWNEPACPWLWSYHDEAVGGVRRYTRRAMADAAAAAGLDILRATYRNSFLLAPVALRRKLMPAPAAGRSDVRRRSGAFEGAFAGLGLLERAWISAGLSVPFGTSSLVIATPGWRECASR